MMSTAALLLLPLLLLSYHPPALSLPLPASASVADSAVQILEEQSLRNVPVDAALRRHVRRHDRSYVDSDEHRALRDVLFDVAAGQYRLDWRLRRDGVECSPENRVALLLNAKRRRDGPMRSLEDDGMDLQTRLECPDWAWPGLNEAFQSDEELTSELRALQRPAPIDLRVNTLVCERREDALRAINDAGFDAYPTPWSPVGIRLGERNVALGKIPGLLEGAVEPQDEGSQLAASLVGARPGETVADYCAGSGGKTLQIAAQMRNRGRLFSLDASEERLERGRPRCSKARVSNVQRQVLQGDMTRKDKWCKRRKRTFDRVLVDAPCSGVGSWRRKPDARRTWGFFDGDADNGAERLADLLPLQQQILRRASRLVRDGGQMVYVTCSLLPEENERQVLGFLDSEEGVGWRADEPPAEFAVPFEVSDGRFLRLTPAKHNTDGFFAAILTRDGD
ncbi:hypothetical protein ACHAWF_001320 [Thalassiosira exigua]